MKDSIIRMHCINMSETCMINVFVIGHINKMRSKYHNYLSFKKNYKNVLFFYTIISLNIKSIKVKI